MTKPRNMGAYCWTHGFHPVGVTHDSKTCEFKKDGHRDDATYSNRYEGNTYWPVAMRVAIDRAVRLMALIHRSSSRKAFPRVQGDRQGACTQDAQWLMLDEEQTEL